VVYLLAALIPVAVLGQATQDYDKRARDIVIKMTLDEKLTELHGIGLGLGLAIVKHIVELHGGLGCRGKRGRRQGSDVHRAHPGSCA
jgi:hypothetical protein